MHPLAQPAGRRPAAWTEPRLGAAQLPCVSDPELFFSEEAEEILAAKAQCARCPVRLTCLNGALQRREPWGVWGGELFHRGVIIAEKRPRGRPRKAAAAA